MAHASTHPAHPLPPVAPRRLLLAQRLLRGEGSVEVTAFRAGETLTTAVHGVSADGRLVVAHVPNLLGSLGAFHTPAPLDVRVDVLRDALPGAVATATDSAHDGDEVLLVRPDGHLLWRGTDPARLARRLATAGIRPGPPRPSSTPPGTDRATARPPRS